MAIRWIDLARFEGIIGALKGAITAQFSFVYPDREGVWVKFFFEGGYLEVSVRGGFEDICAILGGKIFILSSMADFEAVK